MSELKPCPFCGETVSLDYSELPNKKHWYITCDCCGMMYQAVVCQRKDTKTGWNTRLIEDALTARIAELEAENDRLQGAWFQDETICPDGSLRPKVSSLLKRIDNLDAEWKGAQLAADCLKIRISELEGRNEVLEGVCEILRKQNDRLYEQVFSDNKPDLPEEVQE